MHTRADGPPAPLATSAGAASDRPGPSPSPSSAAVVLGVVAIVSAWLTLLVTVALWLVLPVVAGWRPVTVTSASMAPRIRPGDVVMYDPSVRRPPPGAVVVFHQPDGRGLLTHRVESVDAHGRLRTRGDANPTDDQLPVPPSMVLGRVRVVVPMVGAIVRNPLALTTVVAVSCVLSLFFRSRLRSARPRRRRRRLASRAAVPVGLVLVVLATSVVAAHALWSTRTANSANSFSTYFVPNSSPDALAASLGTVGAVQVAVISGHTLFIGGDFTSIAGVTRNRLAAIDLTSDTLTAWDPNVSSTVNTIAVDTVNNLVYVGGGFTTVNGATTRNRLAAIDMSTGVATGWNPNAGGVVQAVVLDATNSQLYAGGTFTTVNGATTRNRLAAVSTATGTATSWDPNVGNNNVYALALDSVTGVIYAGGDFTLLNGATTRNRLAAISTATGSATSWDPNASALVYQIALDTANGQLYVGGTFTTVGGQTRNRVAAVSTVSAQATTWDPNANNTVREVAVDGSAGLVYVGGDFTSIGGSTRNRIAALSVTTTNAAPWNPNADSTVSALTVDPATNTVAFGGSFSAVDVTDRSAIAATTRATTTDGDLPSTTGIDVGTTGAIRAAVLSGTTLYLGGDFTWINGSARKHLAAIDTTTGNLTSWNPTADQTVRAFALDPTNGILYAGGDFSNAGGSLRQHLVAFSTSTGNLTAWTSPANATVNALAVDPAGGVLYAAGSFTNAGWQTRKRIAAVSTATGAATAFDGNLNNTASAVALDTTNGLVYVGGTFTTVNGATTRNRIAALSTSTGTATSWDANLSGAVNSLALDTTNSLLYAGGAFTTVNGATIRNRLAALSTSTATASGWDPNVNNTVLALTLDTTNNAIYLAGTFTTVNGGTTRNRLAALSATTATATAWNPNVNATNVYALAVNLGAGTAYIGGDFTTVNGANREALAAIGGGPSGAAAVATLSISSANNLGAIYATVRNGNTVYIGGTFTYVAGQVRNRLAAIDLAGDTVTSWNPNMNNTVRTLTLDAPNSLLYAGGDFTTVNGATTRNRIAALSTATGTVTSWNPNIANSVYALALDVTNNLAYLSGSFTTVNGATTRNRLAAVSTATGTASAWDPNANNTTESIVLDSTNGLLYAGGDFTTINSATTRNRLAALSTTSASATSWNPNVNSTVNAVALDPTNGYLYATGAFTSVGGLTRNRLTAVSTNTALPAEWNPNPNNTGRALALNGTELIAGGDWNLIGPRERGGWARLGLAQANQTISYKSAVRAVTGATAPNVYTTVIAGNTLYIGGDFTAVAGTPRRRLAAFDLTNNSLTSWNPSADSTVRSIVVDTTNNLLYVGGDFLSVNYTTNRNRIAALSTTTGTATTFDTNMNNVVRALALDTTNNLLYAGGDFTTVNGATTRNRLAALSTSTSLANAFDPNMSNSVYGLALDPANNLIYAGGTFITVNAATTRNRIAALATADGAATAWDANMNNTVRALTLDTTNNLVYAGGDFTTVNGATTRNRIAALSTATATATSWNANANNAVYALALDGGGLLYADGTFTTVNGATTRNRAASLSTTTATATSWNPNLNTNAWSIAISVPIKRLALGGVFTTANGQSRLSLATCGP